MAKLVAVTIYDTTAEVYYPPYFVENPKTYERTLEVAVHEGTLPKNIKNHLPEFCMVEIPITFDTDTGLFEVIPNKQVKTYPSFVTYKDKFDGQQRENFENVRDQ